MIGPVQLAQVRRILADQLHAARGVLHPDYDTPARLVGAPLFVPPFLEASAARDLARERSGPMDYDVRAILEAALARGAEANALLRGLHDAHCRGDESGDTETFARSDAVVTMMIADLEAGLAAMDALIAQRSA